MKRLYNIIGLVIVAVVLYFLLRKINFYEIYLLLTYAKLNYVLLAILATFLTFIVWAFRWRHVFKGNFWFLLSVLFSGAFFNTITPGVGVAGDFFKAHILSKKYKKSKAKILGYVFGDKFSQLAVLVFFSIFSILFILFYVKISHTLRLILEGVLILVFVLISLAIYLLFKKENFNLGFILKKFHFLGFIKKHFRTPEELEMYTNRKIKSFIKTFKDFVKKKENLIWGISLSFLFWIFNYLTAYFLFLAFNYHVNFLSVIIVVTLGVLIGDLSLSPAGVGFNELTMTLLFSAMGIMVPLALLVSVLTRLIYYFFSLVVGGFCLIKVRKILNGDKQSLF